MSLSSSLLGERGLRTVKTKFNTMYCLIWVLYRTVGCFFLAWFKVNLAKKRWSRCVEDNIEKSDAAGKTTRQTDLFFSASVCFAPWPSVLLPPPQWPHYQAQQISSRSTSTFFSVKKPRAKMAKNPQSFLMFLLRPAAAAASVCL